MHSDSGFSGVWHFNYGPALTRSCRTESRCHFSCKDNKLYTAYKTVQYNLTYIGEQGESCLYFAEKNNLASSI